MDYTYAQYIGIIDVVIILGFLISVIIGFKKGFLTKILKMASALFGFLFALIFCFQFASDVLYPWFGDNLSTYFYNNIMANETFASITSADNAVDTLNQLGIPNIFAELVVSNVDTANVAGSIATSLANYATIGSLVIISFLFLFIGTSLIFWILKLVVNVLRTVKFIKVVDGVLGVVLYALLFYIFLEIVFFVLILVYNNANIASYNEFVVNDILGENATIRLSKWFFNNNFFGNLFGLLF